MAKITRSQAEQIENAYKDMCNISMQYPYVYSTETVNGTIYAVVEYSNTVNVYVSTKELSVRINNIIHCEIYDDVLIIEGTEGYARFDISDD